MCRPNKVLLKDILITFIIALSQCRIPNSLSGIYIRDLEALGLNVELGTVGDC